MKIFDLTKNYFKSLAKEITLSDMPALTKSLNFQRLLMLIGTSLILSILLTPHIDFNRPYFKIGSIAPKDIKADRDFLVEDKTSTEQKKREIVESIKSVYDYDSGFAAHLSSTIYSSFSTISKTFQRIDYNPTTDSTTVFRKKNFDQTIKELEKNIGTKLSDEELEILLQQKFSQNIAEKITQLIDAVYKTVFVVNSNLSVHELSVGITIRDLKTQSEYDQKDFSSIIFLDSTGNFISKEAEIILQGTREDIRRPLISLTKRLIQPNLTFNKNATEKKGNS